MSWLLRLYQTYEANLDRVGDAEQGTRGDVTLLPISHTIQNAHITVEITEDGEFHSATINSKDDLSTIIPCTEQSASRAGAKIAPYPLHDKLSYVAGDFLQYGGKIKGEEPFAHYIKQLEEWANSPYACSQVKSIYRYLSKRTLIRDLVAWKLICLDENNQLISKWDKKYEALYKEKPEIFSTVPGEQEATFIRFNVYSPHKVLEKTWKSKEMYESFVQHYSHLLGEMDYCYVKGEQLPRSDKHANKIRNAADKAKLISANDTSGFTFRGRFTDSNDAASISYEVSQKAHNALKWLIQRQGKIVDQRVFLVWGNDVLDVPDPNADSFSIGINPVAFEKVSNTNTPYAKEVAKAMAGYRNSLKSDASVYILELDAATPGRMAVLYYRDMDKELYLDKLEQWHSTCAWLHRYQRDEQGEVISFYGAPATKDIAFAAYGSKANEKVVKGLMERMLPCIMDGRTIPQDIVKSAFYRASNPVGLDKWEWEKTLSITCALINKKEGKGMGLDVVSQDRDYLFGRLLAIADVLERSALASDEKRATNAIRYMNSFAKYPARTWGTIQASIQPYQAKLGTQLRYLTSLIDDVASQIPIEDFDNRPLGHKYLLGFYSQRHELYQKKDKKTAEAAEISENE
jgi:CRISPR-associated protein Csd1